MATINCCRYGVAIVVISLVAGCSASSWRLEALKPPNDAVLVAPHEAEMYDSMVPELAALSYVMADPQEVAKEGDFSFSCNDEASLADVPVEKGNFTHKECFGTFKALFSNHSEKGCFFAGVKCEGHWTFIKAPCGAKVMVCEGLFHHIAKMAIKPEDGSNAPIIKVFKGVGALGTSGAVIAPPPKDDDDDDSMKRLKHKESKEGRDERRRAFYSTLPGAELWADDFMPEAEKKLRKEGKKTVASWRTTGAKGHLTVIKKLEAGSNHGAKSGKGWVAGQKMTYDVLEGKWNATLAETGMSLIPSLELPIGLPGWGPPPPPPAAVDFPKPSFTCNGKPAWWGGRFPCLGSFEMELEFEHPGTKGGDSFTVEIESKCKGFWSGFLGSRCTGFAASSKEWKDYDKWGQCSGKFGVGFRPLKEGVAMGNGCRGKSLGAFIVDKDDDDDEAKKAPKPVLTIA